MSGSGVKYIIPIVFEVAKATGFNANRHLDAIAMSLWPSRGRAPDKTSQRAAPRSRSARRPQAKNAGTSSKPKRGKNAKIGPFIQRRGLKKPPRISPGAKVWSA